MHNSGNFARYTADHAIRYVVLPRSGPLVSDDVRAYLETHGTAQEAGAYLIYQLR